MKKWMALALAAAMMLSMAACGSDTVSSTAPETTSVAISTAPETTSAKDSGIIEEESTSAEKSSAEKIEANEEIQEIIDISGTYIDVDSGAVMLLSVDGTGVANMEIDRFWFGRDLSHYYQYSVKYSVTGENVAISCNAFDETFTIEKTGMGFQLTSNNFHFISADEYYLFENMDVQMVSDECTTEDFVFSLNNIGFTEAVNPYEVWYEGSMDSFAKDQPYTAPDGMVYLRLDFTLTNNSRQGVEPEYVASIAAVYDDGFVYKTFETANNYLVKEPGAYCISRGGDSAEGMVGTLSPLSSETYTMYILIPSMAADNTDVPLHITIRLPDGDKTKQFVYDCRNIPVDPAVQNMYGTWQVVGAYLNGTYCSVETFEESNVYAVSDWKIIVSEEQGMYLQVSNTSTTNSVITVDSEGIVVGNNHWILDGEQLVLSPDASQHYYYEKISDNQTFPELHKQDLIDILTGTWVIDSATRTGSFTFYTDQTGSIVLNGVSMDADVYINMEENVIHLITTGSGVVIHQHVDYTYENGMLSLNYSGDTLTKQ